MGISKRCTGGNLLNYCILTNLLKDLEINYIQRKNYEGPEINNSQFHNNKESWIFEISWTNSNGKKEKFIDCGKTKREASNLAINLAEDSITKLAPQLGHCLR